MSDHTLPSEGTDRDLLFSVLALQLDFLSRSDLDTALRDWAADRRLAFGQFLVQRDLLSPRRRALLEELVTEYLAQHDMDISRGLNAACAAREVPLDLSTLATPAVSLGLATLPSPHVGTLAGGTTLNDLSPNGARPTTDRRYRTLRPHARGALGEVFVAHDTELNREVALKEIQAPYHNHPDSRARFMLEAEITGSLEHPGIVPVYSLGCYADGRPFYAMRFIKGDSLHDAITRFHQADTPDREPAERALSLRGLLTRFVGVCNAIAYAHSRGVIHRDLKPSNIMLGPYGETLVVDWGLAKAFDQAMTKDSIELPIHPSSNSSTQATMLGQAVGTPAFMPPEQASGRVDQMGPASDIYSLGATLYQLLTGTYAFTGGATEVLRQVKTAMFYPPRRVNRQVPAALDAIVMKAMAFRPEDRYATVDELAAEVERWLGDEKVQAHRESIVERSQRWMRNHRPYVYAAAALLLATLVGLLGVVYAVELERKNTAEERDNAESNLALAKKAVDECFQVAKEEPLLQKERMQDVRLLLLKKALLFYEEFRVQKPTDEGIRFDIARNNFRVGYITEAIGQKIRAIESYEKARDGLAALMRDYPANDGYRADLGRVTDNLGVLQRDTGKRDQALASLQQARQLREELVRKHPNSAEHQSNLAHTCNNLGVLHRDLRKPREALTSYEQALEIFRRLAKEKLDDDRRQADLAATLHNVGRLQAENGEPEEALKAYEEARAIREALAKKDAEATRPRADLASTLLNLGALLSPKKQESARARECFEKALALCEAIVQERREVAEYRASLALACTGLGTEVCYDKQAKEAIKLHARAVGLLEELVKQHEDESEYRVTLAGAFVNMGHAVAADGRAEESMAWYDKAISQIRELEKRAPDLAETRDLLRQVYQGRAEALTKKGKHRESLPDFAKALEQTRQGDGDNAHLRLLRAFALAKAGDHRRAASEVEELARPETITGEQLYGLASAMSLAAKAASGDAKLSDRHSARAVELLLRAKLKKFFRDETMVEFLKNDEDLKFLEGRADYKQFLDDLEAGRKKPGK